MKTKKTIERKAEPHDRMVKAYLRSYTIKHKIELSDLLVGMQGEDMVIQSYNEGDHPKWKTLEIITFKENINPICSCFNPNNGQVPMSTEWKCPDCGGSYP